MHMMYFFLYGGDNFSVCGVCTCVVVGIFPYGGANWCSAGIVFYCLVTKDAKFVL